MKTYGIKNVEVVEGMTVVDVVNDLPTPSVSLNGQVVFQPGVGLRVFHNGSWHSCDIPQQPTPELLEVGGIQWDISHEGKQQIYEAALLVLLNDGNLPEPVLLKAADRIKYFLSSAEIIHLAKEILKYSASP